MPIPVSLPSSRHRPPVVAPGLPPAPAPFRPEASFALALVATAAVTRGARVDNQLSLYFLREAGGAASVARTPPHPGVIERRLAALLDDHALPDVCVC